MYQFGPMYIQDLYGESEAEQTEATQLTSMLLLISNCIVIPLALIVGYTGDKFKIWKLMIFFTFLAAFFQAMMLWHGELGYYLYFGFIGATSFTVTVLLLVRYEIYNSFFRVSLCLVKS